MACGLDNHQRRDAALGIGVIIRYHESSATSSILRTRLPRTTTGRVLIDNEVRFHAGCGVNAFIRPNDRAFCERYGTSGSL